MAALGRASVLGRHSSGMLERKLRLADKLAPLTILGIQTPEARYFRIAGRRFPPGKYKRSPQPLREYRLAPDFAVEIVDSRRPSEDAIRGLANIAFYYYAGRTGFRKLTGLVDARGYVCWTHRSQVCTYPEGERDPACFEYGPGELLADLRPAVATRIRSRADKTLSSLADAIDRKTEERLRRQQGGQDQTGLLRLN